MSERASWRVRAGQAAPAAVVALFLLAAGCSSPTSGSVGERAWSMGPRDAFYDAARFGGDIVAVGKFGKIIRSGDGGETWQPARSGIAHHLYSIAVRSDESGLAVGASAALLETTDGGRSWSPRKPPGEAELFRVRFRTPEHGMIVGGFGTAWETVSGGKDWRPLEIPWEGILADVWENVGPVFPHLYDVQFVGDDIWIVGEYGLILMSADGGATWERRAGGKMADPHLFAIAFADGQKAVSVGQVGTILHSEDGGVTWKSEDSVGRSLYDVLFSSADRVVALGDLGTVVISSRGGEPGSWWSLKEPRFHETAGGGPPWLSKGLSVPGESLLVFGEGGMSELEVGGKIFSQSNTEATSG